jgi:hypothetical protein
MNLSTILAGGSMAALAIVYVLWTKQVNERDAQIDAAATLIDLQQKHLAEEKAINESNVAALKAMDEHLKRQAEIAARAQATAAKKAADLKFVLKRIKNAPKSDDGPVAPVLRRELDDLRSDGVRPVDPASSDAPADAVDAVPSGTPADQPVEPTVSRPAPTS